MYERALELGVEFRFGVLVTKQELCVPEVTLESGENLGADLLVAADGDLAYLVILRVDEIQDDELWNFVSTPRVCLWAGPECHVMLYPLKNNTLCNIVLLVPDNLPENVTKQPRDLEEMHEISKD
ncbi:uncharacterized protein A1O9_06900 [Exophiala aquamarina CBS 119918]|uniref:FAD-binding domain-containing protein n=1 Tax=Exophiala aquamarina CBS 119918 TaxID=1182545 RepID=A0A072PA29_9EURO|nr:uncharacterized protein A1O9_06900 [Exophiala aquamarina CBS 119918]KEF56711.1 hypothetical protein A1O9_06900 [Exophiala aquamarina CBS 119918]